MKITTLPLPWSLLAAIFGAGHAGFVVIRADECQPLAGRRIGVDGDHGNALRNGVVDVPLDDLGVAHRDQDAGRLLLQQVNELIVLRFRIEGVRAEHFSPDLQLAAGLHDSGQSLLPVRYLDVGCDEEVILVRAMLRAAATQ